MTKLKIHSGDIGTILKMELRGPDDNLIDLQGVSQIIFYFEKPDGTRFEREGELATDGTDGMIQYVTQEGDIDQDGHWRVQAWLDLPFGKFSTGKEDLHVLYTLKTEA